MKTFVLATLLSLSLFAQDLVVTIWCTNGLTVPNLKVNVVDAQGNSLFQGKSNHSGQFTMASHADPIYMRFNGQDGSFCGLYYIQLNDRSDPTTGTVWLQYYPTNGTCSCAPYVPNAEASSHQE